MGKSTHFIGQPLLRQIINFLDKDKVLRLSRKHGGERYVKRFDGWQHLVVMLYAVIMRFDSLREIVIATLAEARKLAHLGVTTMPRRSTLSDANARRPEAFFEDVYRDLATHRQKLLSDSWGGETPKWMEKLQIIDSTTITLFSNLIFKGAGRNPKSGKKKGGIKVHKVIRALEGVASDIKFTSAATHDSFMLAPENFERGDLLALDRAYIDYGKFEELTKQGIVYVTKMKSGLTYKVVSDVMFMDQTKGMAMRIQDVTFTKKEKNGEIIVHHARIVTYADEEKKKCVSLLTNDFDMSPEDIIAIYKQRWEIETLFKQIKQNFPLHFFYGESANAIKIQIWVTLIANLLLTIMQRSLHRRWSFSNLATTVRITLMYYVDFQSFFENPEKDWQKVLLEAAEPPPQLELEF